MQEVRIRSRPTLPLFSSPSAQNIHKREKCDNSFCHCRRLQKKGPPPPHRNWDSSVLPPSALRRRSVTGIFFLSELMRHVFSLPPFFPKVIRRDFSFPPFFSSAAHIFCVIEPAISVSLSHTPHRTPLPLFFLLVGFRQIFQNRKIFFSQVFFCGKIGLF